MTATVRDRADVMATFRFISVYLMETLARWVPTTPELEVKILMGRHIWEFAQHADHFGRRTNELRAAMHYTKEPTEKYLGALQSLAETSGTGDRIDGFYDVVLGDVVNRYREYLEATDAMVDEPSVRILERALADIDRMRSERDAMRSERPDLAWGNREWLDSLNSTFGEEKAFVAFRDARD